MSALSLAGAAEEILGRALTHQRKEHSLKDKFDGIAPVHQALHRELLVWSKFVEDENRARNAAKHMKNPTDATVTLDIEDATLWMLVRACDNFKRLGLPQADRMLGFRKLVLRPRNWRMTLSAFLRRDK